MRHAHLCLTNTGTRFALQVAVLSHCDKPLPADEAYVGALALCIAIHDALHGRSGSLAELAARLPDTQVRDRLLVLSEWRGSLEEAAAEHGTSGYVVESVPLALLAASKAGEAGFRPLIERVVCLGGDCDSIASMVGQLLGARYGTVGVLMPFTAVDSVDEGFEVRVKIGTGGRAVATWVGCGCYGVLLSLAACRAQPQATTGGTAGTAPQSAEPAQTEPAQTEQVESPEALRAADEPPTEQDSHICRATEEGEPLTRWEDERIEFVEPIEFEVDSDQIRSRSYPVLDSLAARLCEDPSIIMEVQVHTDGEHAALTARAITERDRATRRANAIRLALIARGVAGSRIGALGYERDCPLQDCSELQGRRARWHCYANNRRVEVYRVTAPRPGEAFTAGCRPPGAPRQPGAPPTQQDR